MPKDQLRFRTLTPFWTGGIQETSDRLHETGVLGSMRWWYEAIVRGLGGNVHDPTQHKSQLDYKKYKQLEGGPERERLGQSGLCDVSQVFGATGWQRRFSIKIEDQTREDGFTRISTTPDRSHVDRQGKQKTPTWWLKGKPRQGEFAIQIDTLPGFDVQVIDGLLAFIARWGTLGAKAQMGFGVVELVEPVVDMAVFLAWCQARGIGKHPPYTNEPGLQNMFFARIKPQALSDQQTFNLRHDIRRLFASNTRLRHFVCGSVQSDRTATKIKVSLPYNGQMAVWGWVPETVGKYGSTRDQVIGAIHGELAKHNLQTWREFNSPRDTLRRIHDPYQYLESLV